MVITRVDHGSNFDVVRDTSAAQRRGQHAGGGWRVGEKKLSPKDLSLSLSLSTLESSSSSFTAILYERVQLADAGRM